MATSWLRPLLQLRGSLLGALLFFSTPVLHAASAPTPLSGALFADGRSMMSFFTAANARERIVQLCVVCMLLALFIIMKKFAPDSERGTKPTKPPRLP